MADPTVFQPIDLTARRMAAQRLLSEGRARRRTEAASGFKVAGTLLGALVGTILAPGAGTAAGASIGGAIGSIGASVISPDSGGGGSGLSTAVDAGVGLSTALERLLKIMREEDEAGMRGPVTL